MSKLAEQASVAPNTLYWYFADKDALLVEVLNATLQRGMSEYLAYVEEPLEVQLGWLARVFEELRPLVSTVHARAPLSAPVSVWHANFHAFMEAQFVEQMRKRGISVERARPSARIATFVLEGLMSHECSAEERDTLIRTLVNALD